MLIPISDIQLIYRRILENINPQYISVVLFAALDVDSVCALRIITYILKSEHIMYTMETVSTYTQLQQKIEAVRSQSRVRMLWFINCGGIVDLTEKWFISERPDSHIFLWDVHKPIHHSNIEHNQIGIIDDELTDFSNCPTNQEIEDLQEIEFMEYHEKENEALNLNEQDDQVNGSRRRNKKRKLDTLRKKRLEILKKQSDYYGSQYSGLPSAVLAYRLAKQVNKTTDDLLWLAIIGLTWFYMEGKIDKDIYQAQVEEMKIDVLKSKVEGWQISSISEELDFHFPLLRHWSLYESMLYSPYIVMKMSLWNENGLAVLREFLTSIGISLEQAQQLYKYMPRESRARLRNDMYSKMDKLNMPDLIFSSFTRKVDTDLTLTSSDMSCVITAILEAPQKENATYEEVQAKRRQNFLDAYEILFNVGNSTAKVLGYIEQYKNFMKLLTTEAISSLERDHIPCSDFNYVKIKNDSKEKQVFEHPYSLLRLGGTILSIYQAKRKKSKVRPLVISIETQTSELCTVAGIVPDLKNPFGAKFIETAEKQKLQCRHDTFQANIIVLRKADLMKLLCHLSFDSS